MHVTLAGVGHRFGTAPMLFTGLSARWTAGQVYAVVGPSGSGKSTLLSLVAGWEQPTEGTIDTIGVTTVRWVFQNPHGVARRTALDHVALPVLARGATRTAAEDRARTLLGDVGLDGVEHRLFRELSGGEAQRLMLARAVASAPDLLLVDEPTAQLDSRTAADVNGVLGTLSSSGAIVVVATHDPRTRDACNEVVDLSRTT